LIERTVTVVPSLWALYSSTISFRAVPRGSSALLGSRNVHSSSSVSPLGAVLPLVQPAADSASADTRMTAAALRMMPLLMGGTFLGECGT